MNLLDEIDKEKKTTFTQELTANQFLTGSLESWLNDDSTGGASVSASSIADKNAIVINSGTDSEDDEGVLVTDWEFDCDNLEVVILEALISFENIDKDFSNAEPTVGLEMDSDNYIKYLFHKEEIGVRVSGALEYYPLIKLNKLDKKAIPLKMVWNMGKEIEIYLNSQLQQVIPNSDLPSTDGTYYTRFSVMTKDINTSRILKIKKLNWKFYLDI